MKLFKVSLLLSATMILSACQQVLDDLSEFNKEPARVPVKVVKNHSADYERYTRNQPKASQPKSQNHTSNKVITKRINTTQCGDSDDWYLDGFRVGKSFRHQKEEMFQQRLNYCNYRVQSMPSQFKANWERGFRIGLKS